MTEATMTPTVSVPRASDVLSCAARLAAIPDMTTSGMLPTALLSPRASWPNSSRSGFPGPAVHIGRHEDVLDENCARLGTLAAPGPPSGPLWRRPCCVQAGTPPPGGRAGSSSPASGLRRRPRSHIPNPAPRTRNGIPGSKKTPARWCQHPLGLSGVRMPQAREMSLEPRIARDRMQVCQVLARWPDQKNVSSP